MSLFAVLAVLGVLGLPTDTAAQQYPSKAVRLVIPTGPGGPTDILGRLVGKALSDAWGQPVIIDNKPGAALMIGAEAVARAEPDGHTLLLTNDGPIAINPSLFRKMAYDPARDLVAVSLLTSLPFVLVVHPSVPAKSVTELVALAKSKPGSINFAAGGSSSRLAAELFRVMAGIDIVHVPYKGSGPALTGLLGAEVQMFFDGVSSSVPHIKSGKLRALAISGARRLPSLPDLPTVAEAGVLGYESSTWLGAFAPAKTPRNIVAKIQADMAAALQLPDIRARTTELGMETVASTPEVFADIVKADTAKWAKVIRDAGIPPADQ